jgi:heme exporter protein C
VLIIAVLIPLLIFLIACAAPADRGMGDSQRIVYVHVPIAWFSLVAFLGMATTSLLYLYRRESKWDAWSQAAAEVGWLCCGLTLITGSFWAHEAWGTWWTWDPRLTTFVFLWMVYSGSLVVRRSLIDSARRARVSAVLAALGLVDLPLVTMATRWFRGIHPVSPEMEPAMRLVLLVTVCGFSIMLGFLTVQRQLQIQRLRQLVAVQTDSHDCTVEPSWRDTQPIRVYAGSVK